jgi:2-iminobutanoate/2-iminopropanoate deaminase
LSPIAENTIFVSFTKSAFSLRRVLVPESRSGNTQNFSAAVAAGGLLFVSGQASVQDGTIVPGSFAEEMSRSIENVRRILESWHLSLADVVKVGAYVRDPDDLIEFNALYPRYFAAPLPARTTITGCLPDQIKFEIDAVASFTSRGEDPSAAAAAVRQM